MPGTLQHPILLLADLDRRAREHAFGLPEQVEVEATWDGVAFRLGELRLVAPLAQVKEILEYPDTSRVPGAQAWVRGIANVRGTLLPIMDLNGFLFGGETGRRQSRALVIEHEGSAVGLLVNEVLGMRHLRPDDETALPEGLDARLRPFVTTAFQHGTEVFPVFDFRGLLESPDFMQVAA